MTFTWPGMLWLLSLVPVLALINVLVLRRRRRFAQRYASLFRTADASGRGPGFRRYVPMGLFLLGVTVSILALARPSGSFMSLAQRGTVVLSVDISGSMRARDIKPTRMDAVKEAARTFVKVQPRGIRFGIVAFSGTAILVQPPTSDKNLALAAIERLTPQMFTAIGKAMREERTFLPRAILARFLPLTTGRSSRSCARSTAGSWPSSSSGAILTRACSSRRSCRSLRSH